MVAGLQTTRTVEDQQHALARFGGLGTYLDTEVENLREGLRLGYSAPMNNVEVVIGEMDALLAVPLSQSPFVRIAKSAPSAFRKQLERLETTTIRPAIKRYRDFLKTTASASVCFEVRKIPLGSIDIFVYAMVPSEK